MSSFLARVKSQFSSSSSTSSKKSSPSPPTANGSARVRDPSQSSSLSPKPPPTRQGTISRKLSQLSATSSGTHSGQNGHPHMPARSKTPLPMLELDLDEPLSPGGVVGPAGSSISPAGDDEQEQGNEEKEREVLGKSRWTNEQVGEFVELVAQKMKERDMSTPGLFLPHRVPSSRTTQHTLLALFLRIHQPSLFPPPPPTTSLSLTPPTPSYLFAAELRYTPHVHDLASALLFSLRHLAPSKDRAEWYESFCMWEKEREFDSNVWAQMGGMNEEVKVLLARVGEVVLGAGALVDRTGVGVAKLARLAGFWLLRDGREGKTAGEDVTELVRMWERLGRRMEHLMLAYIRYQSQLGSIPTRLLPLIEGYPFRSDGKQQFYPSTCLLGAPPFTTRPRSVLHLKIRSSTFPKTARSRPDPVYLAEQAFRATVARDARPGQAAALWDSIQQQVKSHGDDHEPIQFGDVFDGETIRINKIVEELFPSRPVRATTPPRPEEPMYRPFGSTLSGRQGSETTQTGSRMSYNRKRSMSQSDIKLLSSVAEGGATLGPSSSSPYSTNEFGMKSSPYLGLPSSSYATEGAKGSSSAWAEFSNSGFGESTAAPASSSTLEVGNSNGFTLPSNPRKLSARSPELSRILANGNGTSPSGSPAPSPTTPTFAAGRAVPAPAATPPAEIDSIEILSIDETFFEWTQDVLMDPLLAEASSFPVWAVYELGSAITTPSTSAATSASHPTWLLISLAPDKPKPAPTPSPPAPVATTTLRPAAPEASEFGRRSPNGNSAEREEKKGRRKSFLGFGSLASLGRRKSASGTSALDFKDKKGNEEAIKSPLSPPASRNVSGAGSTPVSNPAVTVTPPVATRPENRKRESERSTEVLDIGRATTSEKEGQAPAPFTGANVVPVASASSAEAVVPAALVESSTQTAEDAAAIQSPVPARSETPPLHPLGAVVSSPTPSSPAKSPPRASRPSFDRARSSLPPSVSANIAEAVDQIVEHLETGSPRPSFTFGERQPDALGVPMVGEEAAVALATTKEEPTSLMAEQDATVPAPVAIAPVPAPIPVPDEVVPPIEADAPLAVDQVSEAVAETVQDVAVKVEEVVASVASGVVGLLQEVGVVAAPAVAHDAGVPTHADAPVGSGASAAQPDQDVRDRVTGEHEMAPPAPGHA